MLNANWERVMVVWTCAAVCAHLMFGVDQLTFALAAPGLVSAALAFVKMVVKEGDPKHGPAEAFD